MKKKRRIDDWMETVKLLSDIYLDVPKDIDMCVWERTEWSFLGNPKQRAKAIRWLNRNK